MSKTENWHLIAGCPHEKIFRYTGRKYPVSCDISCLHKQTSVATIDVPNSASVARCSSQPLCKANQMDILIGN